MGGLLTNSLVWITNLQCGLLGYGILIHEINAHSPAGVVRQHPTKRVKIEFLVEQCPITWCNFRW